MWSIYDRLIGGIPETETVDLAVAGQLWSMVRSSSGNIGIAMTTQGTTRPFGYGGALSGMALQDVAKQVKSWNLLEASIGMAAINAYYNSKKRMKELSSTQPDDAFCTFGLPIAGKTIGMIGHLRMPSGTLSEAAQVFILERKPVDGDYPDTACEYLLPLCDIVVITGSTLTNKTLPRLLQLSRSADVVLVGPSVPMAPALLDFGIRRLAGLAITCNDRMFSHASKGIPGPPYDFGERFYLEK